MIAMPLAGGLNGTVFTIFVYVITKVQLQEIQGKTMKKDSMKKIQ